MIQFDDLGSTIESTYSRNVTGGQRQTEECGKSKQEHTGTNAS